MKLLHQGNNSYDKGILIQIVQFCIGKGSISFKKFQNFSKKFLEPYLQGKIVYMQGKLLYMQGKMALFLNKTAKFLYKKVKFTQKWAENVTKV